MAVKRRGPLTAEQAELSGQWLNYAVKIAKSAVGFRPELFDLATDAAADAVMNAARCYRPGGGAKFKTYLVTCVRKTVLTHLSRRPKHRHMGARHQDRPSGTSVFLPLMLSLDLRAMTAAPTTTFSLAVTDDPPSMRDVETAMSHQLNARQNEIIRMRMKGFTLQEIAKCAGLTKERVRQIEQKSIVAIRKHLHKQGFAVPQLQMA